MINIFKKILLFISIALWATQISWSQSIAQSNYVCTGTGTVTLSVSPNTGISTGSYVWKNTTTNATVSTNATAVVPSGSYSVTYSTALGPRPALTVMVASIVPTTPTITPASLATPICDVATQLLTSSAASNYAWQRDGSPIAGTTNSITVTGNDVSTPGTYNYTVSTTNTVTNCTATSAVVALKVSPKPTTPTVTAQAPVLTLICGSTTQNLSASGGGSAYSWKRGSTVLSTTTSSLTVIGTDATGTFLYTAALTNSVGCVSDFSTSGITLTLAPAVATPTISLVAPVVNPICGTATQGLTTTNVSGNTYFWKRDGVAITGSTNSITVTGTDVSTAGTYNYSVSAQSSAGCLSSDATAAVLKVSPKPVTPTVTAQAPVLTLICGSTTQNLSASGGGSAYSWRRGSTALPTTTSNLTVTGTDATGTFLYTVASTNSVGCISDFSATGVTLTLAPGITTPTISPATLTTPICGVSTQVLTTANVTGNTYFWKRDGVAITGSTNSITVMGTDVSTPGTYNYTVAVQSAAGCLSSDATVVALKISPKPATPSITPAVFTPNVICATDTKALTATNVTGAIYTWKRNGIDETGSTVNVLNIKGIDAPTGTQNYSVVYKNSVGCPSDESQAVILVFPTPLTKPTISSNGANTFCEGNTLKLNSSYTVSTGFNVWSKTINTTPQADTTTSATDGVTVRSIGTNVYTVKAKDINGCISDASNSFTVRVNPLPTPPIIDKGTTDAICELDSITLTSNNKGTGVYTWNTGRATNSITVKTAGSYSLTYKDGNNCTSLLSVPFVLTINPLPAKPTITNLNKSEFCFREFTSLKASSTTSGATFEWDYLNATGSQIDVAGSSKKTVDEIIRVSVRAVSSFTNSTISKVCKSKDASDVTTITVFPLPATPTIRNLDPLIICPDSVVRLESSASPSSSYIWTIAKDKSVFGSKQTVYINITGSYYVQTTSLKNCPSDPSSEVSVTIREAPQAASILASPVSATVCKGGKVTLKTLISNGNITRYYWRDEKSQKEIATTKDIEIDTSGTFSVRIRDVFGCFATNYSTPVKVNISQLPNKPTISIVKSKIFCDEDSTVVQASLANTTPNGNRNLYRWIVDGKDIIESTNRQFAWKKASSIAVAVTDSNGCKATVISDTIRTTVNPLPNSPTITVRGAIPFCADKNVTLSAVGTTGITYKWSTGATTQNITTNTAGNITVQAINGFGCLSKPSQAIQVRVNLLPTTPKLTANGDTIFCDGQRVRLVSSSPLKSYWWRSTTDSIGTGEDLTSYFATKTGKYFAKVEDANGCISIASKPIAVDSRLNPTPTTIKKIGSFSLDAQGLGDENGYIWQYNRDIQKDLTTRIIKAKKDGDYQVQASISYTVPSLSGGKLVCYSKTSGVLKFEQDLRFEGFSVFPNPTTNGEINVEVIEDFNNATIIVYDLYGKLILERKVDKFNKIETIPLPNYHGNTYIVKVITDGFERTKKVITLRN